MKRISVATVWLGLLLELAILGRKNAGKKSYVEG